MIRPWTRETLEAVDLSVGAERGEVAKPGDLRGPPKLGATVQSSDSEWEVAPTQIFDETVEMSPMTAETIASAANEYPEPEDPFASDQSEAVRYYVKMMRKMRGLS